MKELRIGDKVMHDYSRVRGQITGKRAKRPYRYCVLWEDLREDWYKREVLVHPIPETNRFEVIDHTKPLEEGGGRLVVVPQDTGKVIDYSIQDEGRTLKVFIKES